MKKSILTALLISCVSYAQKYSFVPDTYVEVDKWKFIDILNKNPKPEVSYLLENGKPYNQAYLDSIYQTKDADRPKSIYLSDSVANKITVILKMRTDAEIRETNRDFYQFQKDAERNRKKLIGSTLKNLKLVDLLGKQYTSESMAGKLVFLNFWFTKCAPCIKEMPDLNKLKEKYGNENILYFAITYDKVDLVERFLNKQRLDFTVIPNDKKTIDALGISFYPTNILLDQTGKVLYASEFFNPKSNNGINEIDKLIRKHTKKIKDE